MTPANRSIVITGGASGLGLATARRLAASGAKIVICDLPASAGAAAAAEIGARFVAADVTEPGQMATVFDAAAQDGALRACVHCAGRGATVRVLDRDGQPGSLEAFEQIIRLNLTGSLQRVAPGRTAYGAGGTG